MVTAPHAEAPEQDAVAAQQDAVAAQREAVRPGPLIAEVQAVEAVEAAPE